MLQKKPRHKVRNAGFFLTRHRVSGALSCIIHREQADAKKMLPRQLAARALTLYKGIIIKKFRKETEHVVAF